MVFRWLEHRVKIISSCLTDDLLESLVAEINGDEELMECIQGNPRTMKRIVNILLLACSLQSKESTKGITKAEGKLLLRVVIMIEQWPFRLNLLRSVDIAKNLRCLQ